MGHLSQQLQDRSDVEFVLYEYCRLLDERRIDDLVAAVYHPDGTDQRRAHLVVEGAAALAEMFDNALRRIEGTAHYVTNVQVSVSGDSARSFSYVQAHHWMKESAGAGPIRPADFTVAGTYRDVWARTPEGWRILQRTVGYLGPAGLLVGELPEASHGFGGGPTAYE